MVRTTRSRLVAFAAVLSTSLLPAAAQAADLPDPIARGPFTPTVFNADAGTQPQTGPSGTSGLGTTGATGNNENRQFRVGTVNLQEPNANGGSASNNSAAATVQVRGVLTYPAGKPTPSPLIVLVHGNHGSCRQTDGGALSAANPECTIFERNDLGYQYLAENLASNGYVVASLDQDQLIYFQDGNAGKGMHQRRLLMAALLDGLFDANAAPVPIDADHNLGGTLVGKIDFDRIGLMGHSRGGDATTSFLDFNRTRPAPGRRYNIRASIAVAPVDYERRAPYGTNFLSLLPACDGDVSNLQGARFFERSQYAAEGDPFPKVQQYLLGADHNYFNSVWSADNDDSTTNDPACGQGGNGVGTTGVANADTSIRLSGGTTLNASLAGGASRAGFLGTYSRSNNSALNTANPPVVVQGYPNQANNYFDGNPALMGDQERAGLAMMSEFFRRYVGGETAFEPYLTGELNSTGDGKNLPVTACPTSVTGTHLPCEQYLQTDYFAGANDRLDVIRPETDDPLGLSAVGTALTGSGFSNPYTDDGGVSPKPATTDGGYDWCNPEPTQFTPSQLGEQGYPTATKPCPLPAVGATGGQGSNRENSPVNQSYGLQMALAWNNPVAAKGAPAVLQTRIPAASGDVSKLRSLALGAAVNYFDAARNGSRAPTGTVFPPVTYTPSLGTKHFQIQLTDAAGKVATVDAGARRYGTALQPSTGAGNARLHIVLNQVRVPLADFSAQGLDLTKVRKVALVFGADGMSPTGSVEVSDVRFQETTTPTADPNPATFIAATARKAPSAADPDVIVLDAPPAPGVCTDDAAPTTTLKALSVKRGKLSLRGTASDAGCAATDTKKASSGAVKSVQVKLTTPAGKAGVCRFVKGSGKLTKPMSCASPVSLVASGTTSWALKLGGKLAEGKYALTVLAFDGSGNVASSKVRKLTVR